MGPHGTLTLSLKDLEQNGIAGCMIRFPTLMLLERMLLSSALATNSHTMSTTAMLQESFMTSFPAQVPKWGGLPPQTATTILPPRLSVMASSLVSCVTRITNMT